jgi:hypothetical protein
MARADQSMTPAASSRESPATSVSQTSASMPTADRIARASRCTPASDIVSRSGARASSIQPIARPPRRRSFSRCDGSGSRERRRVRVQRKAKGRAELRLRVNRDARELLDDDRKPGFEVRWRRRWQE